MDWALLTMLEYIEDMTDLSKDQRKLESLLIDLIKYVGDLSEDDLKDVFIALLGKLRALKRLAEVEYGEHEEQTALVLDPP